MNSKRANRVNVKISDPWDLGEALGWKPLAAEIISIKGESALVRLYNPFEFRKTCCQYFVASARYEGDTLANLAAGKPLFCGMTRVSTEQAKSSDPHDLSKWRGGMAMIATVEVGSTL